MLARLFSKYNLLGAALLLILVGEVTVGASNGLYTVPGFIVLAFLYLGYFRLLDSLSHRYHLSNTGLILVNFALYSVLITGLLHGELASYVIRPQDDLITSLIRLQCSLYPVFAFHLLRRLVPTPPQPPRVAPSSAGWRLVSSWCHFHPALASQDSPPRLSPPRGHHCCLGARLLPLSC